MTRREKDRTLLAATAIVNRISENTANTAIVNAIYDKLISKIGESIAEGGVSLSNIIIIVDATMRLVGELKTLTGVEKKAVVITVIHKLIAANVKTEDAEALITIVNLMLDPLIDQIYTLAPQVYGAIKAKCLAMPCCKKN